jgi:hypothetical protein
VVIGRRGSYADIKHEEKDRGEGKAPFLVLRKKCPKKCKKTCSRGGRLAKKREKRLG